MADKTDFYTKTHRSMFRRINEVGAKPFLLFQYYLTYATAPHISPSLKTVALDLGILDKHGNPQISAVSHLKKVLIKAGWISEKNGAITITIQRENAGKVPARAALQNNVPGPIIEALGSTGTLRDSDVILVANLVSSLKQKTSGQS